MTNNNIHDEVISIVAAIRTSKLGNLYSTTAIHNFCDCLPSDQKLTLGLPATITLKVVPFSACVPFPRGLPFVNALWKTGSVRVFSTTCNSASVRVFSIACDSASITSVLSKWWYLQLGKQRKVAGSKVK
jgi:hypothetical protein